MPRYVSPGRTPSPSRSPSRTSRGRAYTDGVYTPTSSPSRSPSPRRRRSRSRRSATTSRRSRSARSPSSDYYYSDGYNSDDTRSTTTRSRSTRQSTRSRLASALDTSGSTGKEKAENVLKTSLVMLGAIGAASLAAHKFWPKGITYGNKDDWEGKEKEAEKDKKEKLKGRMKDGRDKIEGRAEGAPDPDRKRYIEERYRHRPRLPPTLDGDDGAQFWEKRDRLLEPRRYVAANVDPRDGGDPPMIHHHRRIEPQPPPPPPIGYADAGSESERRRPALSPPPPRRYIAATAPVPERDDVTNRAEPARSRAGDGSSADSETRRAEPARSRMDGPPPPPPPPPPPVTTPLPPAPAPPRSFADSAPLVVPAGSSRAGSSGRDRSGNRTSRYYVDRDTIVVPSSGERAYVVQRDAPPGQRLRQRDMERADDRGYYR
ncbi:unnamed protein product [Discula destructiva]